MDMKRLVVPVLMLLAGLASIIYAVSIGQAEVALFIIFPVIYGGSLFMIFGVLLIFLSFFLFFAMPFFGTKKEGKGEWQSVYKEPQAEQKKEVKKESSFGGVVFIGPIPIVFGKDKKMTKGMLYLGLLIAIIMIVFYSLVFLT